MDVGDRFGAYGELGRQKEGERLGRQRQEYIRVYRCKGLEERNRDSVHVGKDQMGSSQ